MAGIPIKSKVCKANYNITSNVFIRTYFACTRVVLCIRNFSCVTLVRQMTQI